MNERLPLDRRSFMDTRFDSRWTWEGSVRMLASKIQPGRYGVVNSGGLLSWLIRHATGAAYDHTFIVSDRGQVIEAAARGVRVAWLSEYTGKPTAFNLAEPMSDGQRQRVLDAAEKMVGYSYDYLDLGALGLASLGWHWRLLFTVLRQRQRVTICSELVARVGTTAGLDWMCGKTNPDEVTPGDLALRHGVQEWIGLLS